MVKHSSKNLYPLEIVEVKTPLGNIVRAYSAERTLCEIMTAKVAADIQTITYAVKTYVSSKEKKHSEIDSTCKGVSCREKTQSVFRGVVVITKNEMQLKALVKDLLPRIRLLEG